jgi:hypothetical protein
LEKASLTNEDRELSKRLLSRAEVRKIGDGV